ncbi:MAG: 2-oxoglutarate dehydrogenase complex dihydrolipoyllysine-residue succinyltransferase [Phycisphaerae bacterium]
MSNTLVDLFVPGLGESVTEARIAHWTKADGDPVTSDDVVAELETDKATVELPAGTPGVLRIVKNAGQTVNVGDVIARIEHGTVAGGKSPGKTTVAKTVNTEKVVPAKPLSPAVERMVKENNIDPVHVAPTGPGQRITKGDVLQFMETRGTAPAAVKTAAVSAPAVAAPLAGRSAPVNKGVPFSVTGPVGQGGVPEETRVEMSKLRETIARRMVEAQHNAAILTTFNEIDMSAVMALREKYKEKFEKTHAVGLGFLSFFAVAVCAAIKAVPIINAQIQERIVIYKNNVHLGVAVATERGLVVPVVRYANTLSMARIEAEIKRLAQKAREGKITIDELGGGTFTITNGGVFGSLLSTPIINPPQSAILGLHKIEKRAVVVDDQIVIRPMMYAALSYDHRLIDGKQAVSFLVHIKESLEDPTRLLLEI